MLAIINIGHCKVGLPFLAINTVSKVILTLNENRVSFAVVASYFFARGIWIPLLTLRDLEI